MLICLALGSGGSCESHVFSDGISFGIVQILNDISDICVG